MTDWGSKQEVSGSQQRVETVAAQHLQLLSTAPSLWLGTSPARTSDLHIM